MPASTRHHTSRAALTGVLAILGLTTIGAPAIGAPATPATGPAVAPRTPATGPAVAPVSPTAAAPAGTRAPAVGPPKITVAVAPAATPAPAYRIQVRNDGYAPVDTTVRQELPAGSSVTTITAGGRATRSVGRADATEVTWQLNLPARSTMTLNTAFKPVSAGQRLAAPACAFARDGNQPYDCATAVWGATEVDQATVAALPFWRRPPFLLAALTALLVLLAGAGWWWAQRRNARGVARRDGTGTAAGPPVIRSATARSNGSARSTVYPRPAAPRAVNRRRTPPTWLVVGVAAAILAGVVGAAGWTATRQVAAIDTGGQPTSGAWVGQSRSGQLGIPLRESAFEFTVYRVACANRTGGSRPCEATVGMQNVTPEQQTWHGQSQRAYLPTGGWVSTDESATRAANQGRDVFAEPVPAGHRVVLPLVFTVDSSAAPSQIELRGGIFSAGVRVALR